MKILKASLFYLPFIWLFLACEYIPGKTNLSAAKEKIQINEDILPVSLEDGTESATDEIDVENDEKGISEPKLINEDLFFYRDSLGRKTWRKKIVDSLRKEYDKLPKYIYFTFDDGPLPGSRIVDSIARFKNIKISTFLVGRHAAMSKKLMNYYQDYKDNPLVECYNHSYSHALNKFKQFYKQPETAYEDFVKNHEDLALDYKITRLPGRNTWAFEDVRIIDVPNSAATADLLFENDFKTFGWDWEWKIDQETGIADQSVEELFQKIKNLMDSKDSLYPNNVVLLTHDNMFVTERGKRQLEKLIDRIQAETDYQFEHMSNYPIRY